MGRIDRRKLFIASVALGALSLAMPAFAQEPAKAKKYVCPTCGCSEDGKEFDKPGQCPAAGCGMTLIEKVDAPPAPQQPASPAPPTTPAQPAAPPQPAQPPQPQ